MEWGKKDLPPSGMWWGAEIGFVRVGVSRDMEHVFVYGSKLSEGKKEAGKWNDADMSF